MRSNLPALLCAAASMATVACGESGPTAPAQVDDVNPTILQVQPDAAVTHDDASGLVNLSVWPHDAGGLVSIETCVATDGRPIAASFDRATSCEAQGGHWTIARDMSGEPWVGRTWQGWATVRFSRETGQAPMLFRTSYEAPRGGATRDVVGCRWILAENSDVGVACTSDDEARVMPWVAPGGSPAPAE